MFHKNNQKRYYIENAIYFVTTKTYNNYPYFHIPALAELFIQRLLIAAQGKHFKLYGYVVMPDHVHVLIMPHGKYSISQIMFTIKKQFSHEANRLIGVNSRTPTTVGGQALARLRNHVITHKLTCRKFKWQSSFHDHIIRDDADFENHTEYIKYNPVKHGLIADGQRYPYIFIKRR